MKTDVYGHAERYKKWKEYAVKHGDDELTKKNSDILIQYILDMEIGANVSTKNKRGGRCPHRLNALRQKLSQIMRMLQQREVKDITRVTQKQVIQLFSDMGSGVIKTMGGGQYKATGDYVKVFKAFWHWWMKINRLNKKPVYLQDITEDLDGKREEKPKWVYLSEKQMSKLLKNTIERYAPFFEFMYDSGARVTEALSLRGGDITEEKGEVYVDISEDIAKTIGRKFKLKLSGKNILKYIKEKEIKDDGLLFPLSAPYLNRYLHELGKDLFGDKISKAGDKYSSLTLYDFRHNSACFWIQRYKTNSAMMYRFGWKSEKYIHYYTEFLGMKDVIRDEDMYVDITKTELEKELASLKKEFGQYAPLLKAIKERVESNPKVIDLKITQEKEN